MVWIELCRCGLSCMMLNVGQKLEKEENENVEQKMSVNIIVAMSNVSYAATIWINIISFLDYMIQKVRRNIEIREVIIAFIHIGTNIRSRKKVIKCNNIYNMSCMYYYGSSDVWKEKQTLGSEAA